MRHLKEPFLLAMLLFFPMACRRVETSTEIDRPPKPAVLSPNAPNQALNLWFDVTTMSYDPNSPLAKIDCWSALSGPPPSQKAATQQVLDNWRDGTFNDIYAVYHGSSQIGHSTSQAWPKVVNGLLFASSSDSDFGSRLWLVAISRRDVFAGAQDTLGYEAQSIYMYKTDNDIALTNPQIAAGRQITAFVSQHGTVFANIQQQFKDANAALWGGHTGHGTALEIGTWNPSNGCQ
jgi:hypothetical protein